MTKSNSSSETSRTTNKLSVNSCCFNKTTKSSPSSSSDSSLDISPPIQDYLNILNSTPSMETCDNITPTLQDLLNLTTSPSSPNHSPQTSLPENDVSFTPMELFHTPPTSPTQQGYYPSSQSPQLSFMELLQSNSLSPSPYLESLDDLPPRSSNPQPLSSYDNIREMETQNGPHQPSLVENLAYRYARPSIFPQDQGHICQPSFVFHPVFKNFHSNTNQDSSFRHYLSQEPPQQNEPTQHFDSLFSLYKKIEASLWDSSPTIKEELKTHLSHLRSLKNMVESQIDHLMIFQSTFEGGNIISQFTPSSSSNPPPTNQTPLPSHFPRHNCGSCERTARISERCRDDIHELNNEMRFILNHILEHLETMSHQLRALSPTHQ